MGVYMVIARMKEYDSVRIKHLEQIAMLEWQLADSGDRSLVPIIQRLYEQLEIYDEMEGYK